MLSLLGRGLGPGARALSLHPRARRYSTDAPRHSKQNLERAIESSFSPHTTHQTQVDRTRLRNRPTSASCPPRPRPGSLVASAGDSFGSSCISTNTQPESSSTYMQNTANKISSASAGSTAIQTNPSSRAFGLNCRTPGLITELAQQLRILQQKSGHKVAPNP